MTHTTVDLLVIALVTGVVAVLLHQLKLARSRQDGAILRLERQNEIGRVLLTDRNLRGVTRHVAESAARLLGSDHAHITLVTDDGDHLVLEAATGPLVASVGAAVPSVGSLAGWVIRNAQPLVLNDTTDAPPGSILLQDRNVPRRAVVLPLIARGRCVGALGVENPQDGRNFGSRDVALLRDLADYAALAIQAIQAIEQLREREQRAAELHRMTARLRQSLDLQQILETAVRELGSSLGVSRCAVRLKRGTELLPTSAEWWAETALPSERGDPAEPIAVQAFRERRTVETSDARASAPIAARVPGLPAPLAVLAVPIALRAELVGVITLQQTGFARVWTAGDVALVESLASDLGLAISNARFYRTVETASRELAVKIGELERANRMKAQFLANMSHELRTPLNSVIGFSEILLAGHHGKLSDVQFDALETIARNGRHLLDLVNDVLDLAKVDAGRMELRLGRLDLHKLVPGVLGEVESLVQAKGHVVRLDLAPEPLEVIADDVRARQVLFNLLSNAIKFTPPGGEITVCATRRRALLPNGPRGPKERDAIAVTVMDNGIGIAADDLPRLFSEFSQVDASHARRYEGTGLGLSLCRKLMDLHGGRIGAESAAGKGSTFWVEFPVEGPLKS